MGTTYSKFNRATGEILFTAATDDDLLLHLPGEAISGHTHYVQGGVAVPRPTVEVMSHDVEIGSAPVIVTGALPLGTTFSLNGHELGEADPLGIVAAPSVAGSYVFRITPPWPYRVVEAMVNVSAPAPDPDPEILSPGIDLNPDLRADDVEDIEADDTQEESNAG
jgi:hypothetical protein